MDSLPQREPISEQLPAVVTAVTAWPCESRLIARAIAMSCCGVVPQLFMRPGRLLYVGPGFVTARHQHHAHQLTVGLQSDVLAHADGPARRAEAWWIPAHTPHRLDASSTPVLSLYVDPLHTELRVNTPTTSLQGMRGRCALPGIWTATQAQQMTDELWSALTAGGVPPPRTPEPRVARALEYLKQGDPLPSVAELAESTGLSSSQFSRLFQRAVGLTPRTYRLWVRLQRALIVLGRGHDLTAAAHEAEFADAAHLSRTFSRMFGLAPSGVLRGAHIVCADG